MKKIEQISLAIKKMYIKMIEQDKKLLIMTIIYMFSFTFFDVIVAFFPKVLLDLYMNNKSFQEGSSLYKLKDGDKIVWSYTCDLGRDVGCEVPGGNDE